MSGTRPTNRPGLDAIAYRAGTFDSFRKAMLARLATQPNRPVRPLAVAVDVDPLVALLDGWAVTGDVLTFYQERLANEGYLRTAQEPDSLVALAALVGHRPSAGVAASVALAYTLDPGSTVPIPAGSGVQSVPGPGETAQFFETSDDLVAIGALNAMAPRQTRPLQVTDFSADASGAVQPPAALFVDGTSTGLNDNDPVLLVVNSAHTLLHVQSVEPQYDQKRTKLTFAQPDPTPPPPSDPSSPGGSGSSGESDGTGSPGLSSSIAVGSRIASVGTALREAAPQPVAPTALTRSRDKLFSADGEVALALNSAGARGGRAAMRKALSVQAPAPTAADVRLFMFRTHCAPFGAAAPPPLQVAADGSRMNGEWQLQTPVYGASQPFQIDIDTQEGVLQRLLEYVSRSDSARQVSVDSRISFAGSTEVKVPLSEGKSVTQAYGDGNSQSVTVTVTKVVPSDPSIELSYVFTKGPSLTVRVASNTLFAQAMTSADGLTTIDAQQGNQTVRGGFAPVTTENPTEDENILYLDRPVETIARGSWIGLEAAPTKDEAGSTSVVSVAQASIVARVQYGQTAQVSQLQLDAGQSWITLKGADFSDIRRLRVHADSVELTLVDQIIADAVPAPGTPAEIELDGFYPGLASGRWAIVAGERADHPGVNAAELVMIAAANQGDDGTGSGATGTAAGQVHTTITLSNSLFYSYKRSTVQISGNVAPATQGQSVQEVLGSGRGSTPGQSFTLKKAPLTYVPAATPSGNASTLVVRVDGQQWHEVDDFSASGPSDRVFVTQSTDDGTVTVRFGDGIHGARLPTGTENVQARYRSGMGVTGNVAANSVTQLMSRPLGVKSVTNPMPGSGGADPETGDEMRNAIPLDLGSLDRLVSTADYAAFALAFAGIAKAAAERIDGAAGPVILLSLAGVDAAPVQPDGALQTALLTAFADYGDPAVRVAADSVLVRLAFIHLAVVVDPDYDWAEVEPRLRAALVDAFGFDRRAIGQTLYRSEAIAVAQGVRGVLALEIKGFAPIAPEDTATLTEQTAAPIADIVAAPASVTPSTTPGLPPQYQAAELIYLSPDIPDLLLLEALPQ